MSAEKPLSIDFINEDALTQILPRSPLLSSLQAGWNGIRVECYRYPPHEIPEYRYAQHKITLHTKLPASLRVERTLDGRFRSEQISAGDVVIVPANTPHSVSWDREAEFIILTLEPTFCNRAAYEFVDPDRVEIVPHFPKPDPLIYQIGLALREELKADGLGSRLYAESMATALSAHLLRHYSVQKNMIRESRGGLPKYKLHQAIDYINVHLDREIELADIAKTLGMSRCYFAWLFKQSMGISPYQYMIRQRLERAKELLRKKEVAIADIALQCGFANQSHFTKLFRKHLATTPKAYRDAL